MQKTFIIIFSFIIFNHSYCDITSALFNDNFDTMINKNIDINKNKSINKIVAIVNEKPITSFDLDQEIKRNNNFGSSSKYNDYENIELKRIALQNIIVQTILFQLAERNKIEITENQVNEAIHEIANRNKISFESLKSSVIATGIKFNIYKDKIRKQLMINQLQQQMISKQVDVSEEEIKKYIKKHRKKFDREIKPIKIYDLNNFIVTLPENSSDRQNKIDLFKKISIAVNEKLIDFKDMVKEFSQASNSNNGGELSKKIKFESIPEIYKNHVRELKNKEASKPFVVNNTLQMIYIDNLDQKKPLANIMIKKYYVHGIVIRINSRVNDKIAKNYLDRATIEIKNGNDFSTVAEKYTQDYDHTDGNFGWNSKLDNPSILPPKAFYELEKLKKNEISSAFKVDPQTWMIIKYTKSKKYNATSEFEKKKALEAIFSEKAKDIYKTWITSIKDDAYIEILEKDLKTSSLY